MKMLQATISNVVAHVAHVRDSFPSNGDQRRDELGVLILGELDNHPWESDMCSDIALDASRMLDTKHIDDVRDCFIGILLWNMA